MPRQSRLNAERQLSATRFPDARSALAFDGFLKSYGGFRRAVLIRAKSEERPTTHYIWRTRGDRRVRGSHRVNEGQVFAWNDPPPTGHPGEEPGCRCWAEPYYPDRRIRAEETVVGGVDNASYRWTPTDFVKHFYIGRGRAVTLGEMGHLQDFIDFVGVYVFARFADQLTLEAAVVRNGRIEKSFEDSYNFKPISYPHGGGSLKGVFRGKAETANGYHIITGLIQYVFRDEFTDPAGVREWRLDSSDPELVSPEVLTLTDLFGNKYKITGEWRTFVEIIRPEKS